MSSSITDDKIKEVFLKVIDDTYIRQKKHNPKLKKKTIATQVVSMVRAKARWDAMQEMKAGK